MDQLCLLVRSVGSCACMYTTNHSGICMWYVPTLDMRYLVVVLVLPHCTKSFHTEYNHAKITKKTICTLIFLFDDEILLILVCAHAFRLTKIHYRRTRGQRPANVKNTRK